MTGMLYEEKNYIRSFSKYAKIQFSPCMYRSHNANANPDNTIHTNKKKITPKTQKEPHK